MKILFIHQNFPGQFKFLAPALSSQGHEVLALTLSSKNINNKDIKVFKYKVSRGSSENIHPWIADLESKTIRAEGCFRAAYKLKKDGFNPDIVIAHSGWGESLFIKKVWPNTKLGIYCEFYYNNENDVGFDPEFPITDYADDCRIWLKNVNNILKIIKRILLSKLSISNFFAPHLIAVLMGLLKTSSVLIVPNKSVPRPVAVFSMNPNAISNGNKIKTAKTLKKSCTVDAAKALLNSLPLLIWPIDTIVLVTVVPIFAPIIMGIAPLKLTAPPLTMPTIIEVVVEEL